MGLTPWLDISLVGFLGLLIGSFLNVVIYRLPKMLEAQWAKECAELTNQVAPEVESFNLLVPRSRCGNCGHVIKWYENVPVLSYLFLQGKCSACGTPISLRYPMVELLTGSLFTFCAYKWGWTLTTAVWCVFSAAMVALAFIDWDTTLLPDDITLPLLWLGLVAAAMQWNTSPSLPDALWGAIGGYLCLWTVYWVFKLVTGKEGMGYGDFKLLAALGAWFGWQALVPIILMSSVIGAIIGIALKFSSQLREGGYIPFGPFLVGAGFTALAFGPQSILRVIGL